MYYDKEGKPLTLEQFCSKPYNTSEYQRIGHNINEGKDIEVSTVWLGIDHNHSGTHNPIIFESMAFSQGDEIDCNRYHTEAEAIEGHKVMCSKYNAFDLHPSDKGRPPANSAKRPKKISRFERLDIE
jgi:hypothetical protein